MKKLKIKCNYLFKVDQIKIHNELRKEYKNLTVKIKSHKRFNFRINKKRTYYRTYLCFLKYKLKT